jgi:hypothetical protein
MHISYLPLLVSKHHWWRMHACRVPVIFCFIALATISLPDNFARSSPVCARAY